MLKVGTMVVGSVEPSGADKVRVTARLVDASGTEFKRSSFEQNTGDPLAMRDVLAGRVAEFLRERLGEEVRIREQQSSTKSPEAWALMQQAERARGEAEKLAAAGDEGGVATGKFAEADSLAKLAGQKDGAWNAPLVLRGQIAYRRSRLTGADAIAAKPFIEQGLALAQTAVERNSADPDALELRGNLLYWKYLLRLEPDKAKAAALLAAARKDLEDSKKINPLQAGAWGTLSHLYYQTGSTTDVLLAARQAYDADAYLTNANVILSRLFLASYDLGQEVDAQASCEEGQRRFPNDPRFAMCQLMLMTMRGQEPDVAKAWSLATSEAVKNDPSTGSPEFNERQAQIFLAAVLAKAGLKDSARAVVQRARPSIDVDPTRDLAYPEAFVLSLAGDKAGAIAALKTYLAANPDKAAGLATDPGWWLRDLAGDPDFKSVVGAR